VLEARLAGEAGEHPVLGGDRLLEWQLLHAGRVPEAALVQGEGIGRQVIRSPVEHFPHGTGPRVEVEPGQAVDQVDADVVEAGRPGRGEGGASLGGRVPPVEARQDGVIQALDAEADPGHPGAPIAGQAGGGDVVGVALHGDLGPGLEGEAGADPGEHGRHLLRVEQRGRTAAEEEAVERDAAGPRRGRGEVALAEQRGQEAIQAARGVGRRVERAVPAALDAEGQMHVGAEPGGPGPPLG
jgi:hypothetical protein